MEWTGARYADKPSVEVQTWIDAPRQRVWELVANVELMPTMSQELQAVEGLDGATEAVVGARFVGNSKHEALGTWSTTSEVTECEPELLLAWAVEQKIVFVRMREFEQNMTATLAHIKKLAET